MNIGDNYTKIIKDTEKLLMKKNNKKKKIINKIKLKLNIMCIPAGILQEEEAWRTKEDHN